ncbi:MAG: terminase small subunit [Xanthomonadaceae bacterium]|jgi:phage terminase small subunit|nr:terminase small subunit [Xanthomonadaceae bacterium]
MAGRFDPATGLQDQQRRFADEYLIDFNATAAYQRAGYKAKGASAEAAASRLLGTAKVQEYLTARKRALMEQTEIDQQAVLLRLQKMALGDIRSLFDEDGNLKAMSELTADEAALLQGIEVFEEYEGGGEERRPIGFTKKIRFINRLDSVKLLGQHFGLFSTKKIEHTGKGGGPIETQDKQLAELLNLLDGADTGIGPAASRKGG